ncbi:DUF4339 domain-containing protein [Bdellovibrio bacteriovorus]|uniref:DUF4339 domain-containing protein n=1 Tax=Bdellovibrio bacteriovorus TaxID=959 RepID=UPI0021D2AF5A|nr:DUF4339 domain-containing protein [Bdellovibrio bacteriovorus]UXR63449.1 DUF4339 domain-containing protein [Bdellovibrio bacteriovorus]
MKKASWYYNKDLKPQGPLSQEEMRLRIYKGEVGPHDLISCEATGEWKPAYEWGVFEMTLFPAAQKFIPGVEVAPDEKEWVLLVSSEDGKTLVQEGPYSVREIQTSVTEQRISLQNYVWKSGLSGWCKIQDRPEFI